MEAVVLVEGEGRVAMPVVAILLRRVFVAVVLVVLGDDKVVVAGGEQKQAQVQQLVCFPIEMAPVWRPQEAQREASGAAWVQKASILVDFPGPWGST